MRNLLSAIAALTLTCVAAPAFAQVQLISVDTTMDKLLGDEREELLLASDHLDLSKLDYSLASLKEIDVWLEAVHKVNLAEVGEGEAGNTLIGDGRGRNTVTLAGLYLGETVRRNSNLDWQWTPFDQFISENPAYAEHYGDEAGLDIYVLVGKQGVATPINSALKRVINGGEDSVAYVGEFLSTPIEFGKAVEGFDPGPEPEIVKRELEAPETSADDKDAEAEVNQLLEAVRATKAELKAQSL